MSRNLSNADLEMLSDEAMLRWCETNSESSRRIYQKLIAERELRHKMKRRTEDVSY